MQIVMTGATGFLGRRLLPHLMALGRVWALGRTFPDDPGVAPVSCDLARGLAGTDLPERIDVVVHLAQSRRHREFPDGAADVFAVNVAATAELLDYALQAGASQLVLASTGSVYQPFDPPLLETSVCAPTDHYSATKLAAEALTRPYARHFAVFRPRLFCLYGAGQRDRLVPDLRARIQAGQPVELGGTEDGLVVTPTLVDDVVAVLIQAIQETWSGTLNVASPEALSLRSMAELLAAHLDRPVAFRQRPDRPAPRIVPDLRRLEERYSLGRFRRFRDGLGEVCG